MAYKRSLFTTPGQDGHGTRPKRPGSGVGPGGSVVEDRVRCVYAGRIWGSASVHPVAFLGPLQLSVLHVARAARGKGNAQKAEAGAAQRAAIANTTAGHETKTRGVQGWPRHALLCL